MNSEKGLMRYLSLDGGSKSDPLMSTMGYIESWWSALENPSFAEQNYYKLWTTFGKDLSNMPMQFFCEGDSYGEELKKMDIIGRCHWLGHDRSSWGDDLKNQTSLWLGYVDVYESGVYVKTIKHTFFSWDTPGDECVFDVVLCKLLLEKPGVTFKNHFGFCVPDDFPKEVEYFLEECGQKRRAMNYSYFLDHVGFQSKGIISGFFQEMEAHQKNIAHPSAP
jgi:hypothetical protein